MKGSSQLAASLIFLLQKRTLNVLTRGSFLVSNAFHEHFIEFFKLIINDCVTAVG